MPTYPAVFFDAFGTLWDVNGARDAVARVAAQPDRFVAEWRRRQLEYTWLRTLMQRYVSFEEISLQGLEATAAAEGLRLDEPTRADLLRIWLTPPPFDDTRPAIARLAQLPGTRLGILSNGDPGILTGLISHAGLVSAFPWVISAEEAKAYKPAPAVYGLAVEAAATGPEQVLFVSANFWDVAGAASVGLTTCWVNRARAAAEKLGQEPRFVVSSLAELPAIVGGGPG
jgi:2-haloacid dehalogenase